MVSAVRRPRFVLPAALVVAVALAAPGCADDAAPGASTRGAPASSVGATTTTTTATTTTATTTTATTTTATTTTATTTTATTTIAVDALAGVTAVAELGYPRDLLDRGRVNVVLTRDGDEAFVVLRHQLVVEGFDPALAEERRIVVPGGGQRVAVQARFGEVVDCVGPTPLPASLVVRYTFGADPVVRDGSIVLADTETLVAIRARYCTARQVLAENQLVLGEPTVDGETVTLDLTIVRRSGDAELTIHAIDGTVLFGVESPYEQGAPERTLSAGDAELVLPLTFDVNRCDPHAVAETTRKKGLTLWVAVDDAAPQPVDVDIAPIDDDLEEILVRCQARTGQ